MKGLRLAALALVALSFSAVAPCQEKKLPLPKDLPPYGPPVPFHAPQVEVRKLANGLTLWLVPRPGYPKVALSFAVRGGRAADPPDRPGFSDLLLATLDQGTKTRTAKQIAEEIQAAGGDLTGNATADFLLVQTGVLSSKADKALALVSDVVENATFPESEVALAKRNAADRLRANEASPSFLARRELNKEIFGGHPYSVVSPTQASITATTRENLRQAFERRFRPDQTLLVAVGDFEAAGLAASVEKLFGRWKSPSGPAVPMAPKPAEQNPHAVYVINRPGSVQTTFLLGAFGPLRGEPDYAAARVANAIYGGMFGSRLVLNIREDKGYTYSPGANLQTLREAGLIVTRADVRNPVTGASLNEIDYELNRMATTSPTEEEMDHARRYLIGVEAFLLQSQESVAGQLATLWALGLPPGELGLESERLQKVAAQEVDAVARKFFPAARWTMVAVGEEKVIREQLAPLGFRIHSVSH